MGPEAKATAALGDPVLAVRQQWLRPEGSSAATGRPVLPALMYGAMRCPCPARCRNESPIRASCSAQESATLRRSASTGLLPRVAGGWNENSTDFSAGTRVSL
jgi:hypothetical protein